MKRKTVIAIGVATAVVAAIGGGVAYSAASNRPLVGVATVTTATLDVTASAPGTLVPAHTSGVYPPTSGTLASVQVRDGAAVKAGEVLARMDTASLKLAVAQAKAAYSQALAQGEAVTNAVPSSGERAAANHAVATGASIVDMDFFEALGFKHYQGTPFVDDKLLRSLYIDRIYDTYISEDDLQHCDKTIKKIADTLEARPYSSREFIAEMGKYLVKNSKKKDSLVQAAYENHVPIFCPAFSDSSAGFGLVLHQVERPDNHMSIDSVKDFLELTNVKIKAGATGLLMIGGGVPKNFAQDTVVCAEIMGHNVPMHKYAIQITVADVRDGACSSSTLKEANSWGKVDSSCEQMVYAEATTVLPLLASYAYHKGSWKGRKKWELSKMFDGDQKTVQKKIKK